jgi:glycosyltransferase involved in cell wall biosynthesis
MQAEADVAVIIAAKDERDRIAATVKAARELPGVDLVVVVDDGSADATGRLAREAGATVVRHSRNRGKGTAMETGAEAVRLLDQDRSGRRPALPGRGGDLAAEAGERPRHLLFLDADLADTARAAAPLIEPVRRGEADMTIAAFSSTVKLGGRGLVLRLSRDGIRRATGWEATQPLNGQRCLTRAAFEAALPLATGFGVETALTIDLLHRGFRVVEVEVPLAHRATGTDLKAQLHRARQFRDVARALAAREPSVARGLRRLRGLR